MKWLFIPNELVIAADNPNHLATEMQYTSFLNQIITNSMARIAKGVSDAFSGKPCP
ncbi:hypothetical protein [Pedobacter sp. HMWF019]|uniref:hypothetical protein n=1 Tax=Pedobacter sp. HMWF019 TaxID=2056856 RepID=UPI001304EB63|nr:hypothetical protein [Pedobacter sp. HMWF019]